MGGGGLGTAVSAYDNEAKKIRNKFRKDSPISASVVLGLILFLGDFRLNVLIKFVLIKVAYSG